MRNNGNPNRSGETGLFFFFSPDRGGTSRKLAVTASPPSSLSTSSSSSWMRMRRAVRGGEQGDFLRDPRSPLTNSCVCPPTLQLPPRRRSAPTSHGGFPRSSPLSFGSGGQNNGGGRGPATRTPARHHQRPSGRGRAAEHGAAMRDHPPHFYACAHARWLKAYYYYCCFYSEL